MQQHPKLINSLSLLPGGQVGQGHVGHALGTYDVLIICPLALTSQYLKVGGAGRDPNDGAPDLTLLMATKLIKLILNFSQTKILEPNLSRRLEEPEN